MSAAPGLVFKGGDLRASAAPAISAIDEAMIRLHDGEEMDDGIARAARAKKGSPFLSTEQAGFYLGLSARTMQTMRAAGTGPAFRRHSRYVRYHIDDLDQWSGVSAAGRNNG